MLGKKKRYRVLIVGGGGREFILYLLLANSPLIEYVIVAPGNGGIPERNCRGVSANDIPGLLALAKTECIDFVVVGPELPLINGITDEFEKEGISVFGPSKMAAMLEGSKVFCKDFCDRHGIAIAEYVAFKDPDKAILYLRRQIPEQVVKCDGPAAGKGVEASGDLDTAIAAVQRYMVEKVYGSAGDWVVIERKLKGVETSCMVVCDGTNVKLMPSSFDHKRALTDDLGDNSGGMGSCSPDPLWTPELEQTVMEQIVMKIVRGMAKEQMPFVGVLYVGLMIVNKKPYVLEVNVRFGDPEAQASLIRLKTDLAEIIVACLQKRLNDLTVDVSPDKTMAVVLASDGYPVKFQTGFEITGIDDATELGALFVPAGVERQANGGIKTAGGRVACVVGRSDTFLKASMLAYAAASAVKFDNKYFRTDIGKRVLEP